MKNDKIADAYETIQPSSEIKNRVLEKIKQKQYKKHSLLKPALAFAVTAAVICVVIFGNMFLQPQSNNIFSLKAYAMEHQEDGTMELHEIDIFDESYRGGVYYDSEDFYFNIGLGIKCEGENIRSVELITDDSFFAAQYIQRENGNIVTRNIPMSGIGSTIYSYGDVFEAIGNSIMLGEDMITEDFLLFLAQPFSYEEYKNNDFNNLIMTFRAVVTFNDGETQEQRMTITSANFSTGSIKASAEEMAKPWYERYPIDDITKFTDAFIEEAKSSGLGEVKVNNIVPHDEIFSLWCVSFDAMPETAIKPGYLTNNPDETGWITEIIVYATYSVYNEEYAVNIIGPTPVDIMKLSNAFHVEATKKGIDFNDMGGMTVEVKLYDHSKNIWDIRYFRSEFAADSNESKLVFVQSYYVSLSIDNDEYTVNIIGTEP